MENKIEITQVHVENEKLDIRVKGFLGSGQDHYEKQWKDHYEKQWKDHCEKQWSAKIRLTIVFRNGEKNRRFPVEADSFYSEEEKGFFFMGKGRISLPDIFYLREGEVLSSWETTVEAEAFDGKERLLLRETGISLPQELFLKKPFRKGLLFSCYRVVAGVICVFLLPFFLADGFFAVKGYKPLDTGENKALGLRGVLLHANAITKRLCGFCYSLREWKTKYLKHCYEHYAKGPVCKDHILLLSERPLEENSNMALIREELLKDEGIVLTEFIHTTTINKLKFSQIRESAKKMAKARCILLEDFYPQLHGLSVRKETKVVQLWHACGSFKTFGFSRLGKPGGPQENSKNHRNYDYAMVSGSKMVPIYSEAFGIPEQNVKALGVPRTDIFFQEGYREAIKDKLLEKYPQMAGKKIILFAPTFRGAGNRTAFYPTDKIDWNRFFEEAPEDYFVILKNHPFVKNQFSYDKKWESRILDLTGKDNINDLLFVTDLLITDYSSSVFEAALLLVPMVFYVFDKEEYLKDRDIYYDFDSFAPGSQVKTQEELLVAVKDAMEKKQEEEQKKKYQWFREEFLDALSGDSTEKIVGFIKEDIME